MAPPAERIKIDRKALREPDEFQTISARAAEWFDAHRTVIIAAAAAAAALAIGAGLLSWQRGRQAQAAAIRFQAAHADFRAARWAEAAEAFAGLGRDYAGTPYGRLSALYEGHALARKPDPQGAATAYTNYLSGAPATEYLRQEALIGLAAAKEASGDAAGARQAYTDAVGIAGPFQNDARLGLARQLEAAGETAQAREQYEAILKASPSAALRSLAESRVPAGAAAGDAGSR